MPPSRLLPSLLVVLLLLPGAVSGGEKGFGKARAKMMRGLRAQSADERAEAVYALDGFDSPEAVQALVKAVLSRKDRAQVIKVGIELLGGMRNPESLEALAKEAASGDFRRRARVLEALGRTRSKAAVDPLLTAAYDEDPRVRTAALLAMRHTPPGRCDLALADGLASPHWPVRSAAAFMLGRRRPKEAVPKLVERLKPGVEEGRILADVHEALMAITDKRFGFSYEVWKRWLDEQEGGKVEGEVPVSPPRAHTAEMAGVKSYASRVLFVLAVNRSMIDEITIDPQKVAPLDVRMRGGKELEEWKSVDTKIELARLWVAWAVTHLAPEVRFNVITYGASSNAVFPDLVPATKDNREKAARRVESLSASGEADLYGGLMSIFELVGKDPLDDASLLSGPEVVYFVSDGNIERGEIREAYRATEEAERLNIFRQIRFNTFGIGHHDGRVLADLAGMAPEGDYVSLP